jgi:cardiolipin synthase
MTGPVFTIPNLITAARGLAAAPIAAAVLSNRFGLALALVVAAGLTDGLDGFIARRSGTTSDLGRMLDPIADKLLLVTLFVSVSVPGRGFDPLPLWLVGMAVGRDVAILAGAAGIFLATGFSGFTPTFLGKLNTVFELGLITLFLATRAYGLPEPLLVAGVYATAVTIAASGIHYVFHARRQLAERAHGLDTRPA